MRTYLVALAVEPVKISTVYASLPLHCTVVQYFSIAPQYTEAALLGVLRDTLQIAPRPILIPEKYALFGPNEDVPVHTTRKTQALTELHTHCLRAIEQVGGTLLRPEYCGVGYKPHVTITEGRALLPGERFPPRQFYVVRREVEDDEPTKTTIMVENIR